MGPCREVMKPILDPLGPFVTAECPTGVDEALKGRS